MRHSLQNMVSVGIMGVAGILINLIIAGFYGAAILGIFNLAYAIYIFFSQAACLGIHLSLLQKIAQNQDSKSESARTLLTSALILVAVNATLVTGVCFTLKETFVNLFQSAPMNSAITSLLPGLFFFAMNKTWLAYHNGLRQMTFFAVIQATRGVLMIGVLIVLIQREVPGEWTPAIFSVAEGILFFILLAFNVRSLCIRFTGEFLRLMRDHLRFGSKAVLGNALLDINTRVDVLMLGIFTSDAAVGVYSFAAMFVDGFNQLPAVLRSNVNPILASLGSEEKRQELKDHLCRGIRLAYRALVPVGILCSIGFFLLLRVFPFEKSIADSLGLFMLLMAGALAGAGYLPFQMIFYQIGRPGTQTVFLVLTVLTNVVLNLVLIPWLGIIGAALATSAAILLGIAYWRYFVLRTMNLNI